MVCVCKLPELVISHLLLPIVYCCLLYIFFQTSDGQFENTNKPDKEGANKWFYLGTYILLKVYGVSIQIC